MRRGLLHSGVLACALLLSLVACSSAEKPDSPVETAPELGACRLLDGAQIERAASLTEPVPCSRRHTAETFLVGELPAGEDDYSSPAHGVFAYKTCTRAFAKFLGADESLALRTRLSWAWFRPSRAAWTAGKRWLRCDLIGGPMGGRAGDHPLQPLPATGKGLLSKEEVARWMAGAKGEVFASAAKVSCDQAHDWRAVTAVKIGAPKDPYPGDRVSEVRARDNCSDWVGAWLNYTVDYEYGYSIFHEAEWRAGNRRSLCWARTDR